METYEEYPIRCKTCNEQIACFAPDFKALLEAGFSAEDALNDLGIMMPCSRTAMIEPTFVAFNMENREVIEGFKSVDAATEADAQRESIARPIFSPCLGATTIAGVQAAPIVGAAAQAAPQAAAGVRPGLLPMLQPRVQATPQLRPGAPGLTQTTLQLRPGGQVPPVRTQATAPALAGLPTLGLIQQAVRPVPPPEPRTPIVQPIIPAQAIQPIIPGIDLEEDIEALGVGIPVRDADAVDVTKFREPVTVGVPTINPDPTIPQAQVYVGAGKYVRVLNGRTYLAQ